MSTGEIHEFYKGAAQTNGSVVVTAGGLAFWGDLGRHFYALDATSGKVLWQTAVGGSVAVSTITYAVNGKQYVAMMTGDGLMTQGLLALSPEGKALPKSQNAVYVFALPDQKK
jgi:outer membrane protein assembly factor BamB